MRADYLETASQPFVPDFYGLSLRTRRPLRFIRAHHRSFAQTRHLRYIYTFAKSRTRLT